LTKRKVQDKESIRIPTRPFTYQSFPAFVAGLLAHPGVEDMLDRAWERKGTEWEGTKDMWDIWDGQAIHELEGVDNKPFSDGPAGSARLVWNSVAAAPEPVFLKTDHCARNKNVKFSKIFTYMALILTFLGKKDFLNFTENRLRTMRITVLEPVKKTGYFNRF
jgi:hypothetical protein